MKEFLKNKIIYILKSFAIGFTIIFVLWGTLTLYNNWNQDKPDYKPSEWKLVTPSPEEKNIKVDVAMDVLQALADFYIATVTLAQEDDFTSTMTALLNQNKYLESGKVHVKDHLDNRNKVIRLTTEGMSLGADMVIKANTEAVQFIRKMNQDDPNIVQEFQYVVAKYLSDEKEGYKTIAMFAPQITVLLFEPAKTKNPTGQIPYTITKEEREMLLEEIERLFGEGLKQYREDIKNNTNEYNAILFSVDAIYNNLIPETYEEAKKG